MLMIFLSKIEKKKKGDHLPDLKLMLDIIQKYQLKMNPTKSSLGVSGIKLSWV